MTALDNFRALYRASKKRTIRKDVVAAVRRSKADTRAREMIERWQDGQTHQEIADALGVTRCCVTRAISRYLRRHPDCRPTLPGAAGVAVSHSGNPTTFNVSNLLHEMEATS